MCTLTFLPKSDNRFILTSNRDESPGRKTFPPEIYRENQMDLLYPKDAVAGGTWIGASQRNRVVSLMNGGFVPHIRKASYGRSRGLIVKDLLTVEYIDDYVKTHDFREIEPFTAVVVEYKKTLKLSELVWTGEELVVTQLPIQPRIWSSSPLYPKPVAQQREKWFALFLKNYKDTAESDLLSFHQTAGEGNLETNLVMDRGFVKTKSITQIVKAENSFNICYVDLESGKIDHSSLNLNAKG